MSSSFEPSPNVRFVSALLTEKLTRLQQPQTLAPPPTLSPPLPSSSRLGPRAYQLLTTESIISAARLNPLLFTKSNLSHPQSIPARRCLLLSRITHIFFMYDLAGSFSSNLVFALKHIYIRFHSLGQMRGEAKQFFGILFEFLKSPCMCVVV